LSWFETAQHWRAVDRFARNMLADGAAVAGEALRLAPAAVADGVPLRMALYRIPVGLSLARLRAGPAKPATFALMLMGMLGTDDAHGIVCR